MYLTTMFIAGDPIAQPRPRVTVRGKHGVAYVPRGHAIHAWRAAIRKEMERCVAESGQAFPVGGVSLRVSMTFYLRKPKSNKKPLPTGKPDVDNLAKAALDSGNGLMWRDDSEVTTLEIRKRWDTHPGLWLMISEDTP